MSKLPDAQRFLNKGEKLLKKSFFRWSPDYTGAGGNFERAATIYAQEKQRAEALKAWKMASDAYKKALDDRKAGSAMENICNFLLTNFESDIFASQNLPGEPSGTLLEIVGALESASCLYRVEDPSRALNMLHRGVDLVERVLKKDALNQLTPSAAQTAGAGHPSLSIDSENRNSDTIVIPNPLYHLYIQLIYRTLSFYVIYNDREAIFPHRVPAMCRNAILRHLYCGEYSRAIAVEKHMLGCVLPEIATILHEDGIKYHIIKTSTDSTKKESFLIEQTEYNEEYNIFKRLNQASNAAKAGLEIMVLTLYSNHGHQQLEVGNAELQALTHVFGFNGSPEQRAAAMLLSALEEGNQENVNEVLQEDHTFIYIMARISQLAMRFICDPGKSRRDLSFSHDSGAKKTSSAGNSPKDGLNHVSSPEHSKANAANTSDSNSISTSMEGARSGFSTSTRHQDPQSNYLSVSTDLVGTPPPPGDIQQILGEGNFEIGLPVQLETKGDVFSAHTQPPRPPVKKNARSEPSVSFLEVTNGTTSEGKTPLGTSEDQMDLNGIL